MKRISLLFLILICNAWLAFAVCATTTINGQCIYTDAAPTISACGTSPSASMTSSSNGGTITVGTSSTTINQGIAGGGGTTIPVTNCTLTFATAFTAAPTVTLTTFTPGFTAHILAVSTTALTVTFTGGNAAGQKFTYNAI